MPARRKGRILAFQALYSWDALGREARFSPGQKKAPPQGADLQEILEFPWLETSPDAALGDFSRLLIQGTVENIDEVDAMIRSHLQNWDLSRLNRVDLAVLRMSTYTLMYQQDDIPPSVIIDEAIGICKEYSTDDSFRFVNGVLDGIRKTIQAGTLPAASGSAAGSGPE